MSPAKVSRIVHIGNFNVSSGCVVATDPSRSDTDGQGQAIFSSCASGLWHAFVEDDTAHTYKLIAIYSGADPSFSDWTISLGDSVAVTTCQAGLFDKNHYQFDQSLYNQICDLTVRTVENNVLNKVAGVEGGCFDGGAVTGTATESDDCLVYTLTNSQQQVVGIAISFYKSYFDWNDISLSKILPA